MDKNTKVKYTEEDKELFDKMAQELVDNLNKNVKEKEYEIQTSNKIE